LPAFQLIHNSTIPVVAILILIAIFPSPASAANCSTSKIDEFGIVSKIYDGDTIKLTNGKKIRLIGINTPEMRYGKGKPEPLAKKAKAFTQQKTLKRKVGLRYGAETKDKYGRKLAHVFLANGANLQQQLLEKGLASQIAIPPNLWQQKCYEYSEKLAQKKSRGIWQKRYFKPLSAAKVSKRKTGFKFVTGTVKSVEYLKNQTLFHLNQKFSLHIKKQDLPYFKNFYEKDLINKVITAKGWISADKGKFTMRIRHPSAIK